MTNRIRIGRSLPPAAAPIPLKDVLRALPACFQDDVADSDFVKEIKQDFGQKFCLLASTGKAGLVLILEALRALHPDRDEVVIPAFTCYSVPAAVKKAGLKIRLCDTGKGTLDYDKVNLAEIVEKNHQKNKILCVLITHLFGCPADFDGIKAIVGDTIPLVEDAAQAMGEEKNSKKLGTQADVGFFSLGRGKALSTMDGGIVITSRDDIGYELLRLSKKLERFTVSDKIKLAVKAIFTTLMQHPAVFWLPKSMPFLRLGETIYEEDFPMCLMSSFQISLTHNWRKRLQRHQRARREHINFWRTISLQNSFVMCRESRSVNLVRLPVMVLSAQDRDKFCRTSNTKGCGIMPTYPTAINDIPQISGEFAGQLFPNAQYLAEHLLTLPVHEYVQNSDRTKILDILNS
ncbi:MAG: DegT/DnrJ/EryC1/StrS family aminotransferase [Desulforhopalus sp.]